MLTHWDVRACTLHVRSSSLRGKLATTVIRQIVRRPPTLISHKVSKKSFCKSPFPHKSVIFFFLSVKGKDMLTDLWGVELLQNDF